MLIGFQWWAVLTLHSFNGGRCPPYIAPLIEGGLGGSTPPEASSYRPE